MSGNPPICLLISGRPGGLTDFAGLMQGALSDARVVSLKRDTDLSDLGGMHLVLQYAGYEFQQRGTPLWLLPRVHELRKTALSFGVFFHELYANGPPWRSAFWLSPWQRLIVRKLAGSADYWMTNRQASADWILEHSGIRPYHIVPVCSNVGEIDLTRHPRHGGVVVFGTRAVRERLYRQHGHEVLAWAKRTGMQVNDVGASIQDSTLRALLDDPCIVPHGRIDSAQVSRLLRDARYGVVDYPIDFIGKSGVFAAYCAHGVCPIVFSPVHRCDDGLERDVHYLSTLPATPLERDLHEAVAYRAWQWYQPHRTTAHVQALLAMTPQVHPLMRPVAVLP